jgi:hypothetical protein
MYLSIMQFHYENLLTYPLLLHATYQDMLYVPISVNQHKSKELRLEIDQSHHPDKSDK